MIAKGKQDSYCTVLQAPPVPAARVNRSRDSLLGPGGKGLQRLFRAAFYTVSKLVPRELLLLGTYSSRPPHSLKWWACHSQGVSIKPTGQQGREKQATEACSVMLSFPESRLYRRHALTSNCILPVKAAYLSYSMLAHYYWTLPEQQSNLIMQLKQLL